MLSVSWTHGKDDFVEGFC